MAESGLKLNKWTLVGKNGYSNANSFLGLVKQTKWQKDSSK
jgi:hypothetical protein